MSSERQEATVGAAGALSAQSAPRSAAAIAAWCVDYLASAMELPPERIEADATFAALGMDSVVRTSFQFALEELLNVPVSSEDLIERPTIAALAGAAALLLTLIESYLVIGGAVLLLGFGASRWTAPIAEGYFGYVIRIGTRLLFFYLVLGIGMQLAIQWQTALTAACNPVATTLPWYYTYGAPPKMIITAACSNAIPVRTMLDLAALSIVFLIVTLAVPYTAAGIVSGTVGLALTHAFEAAYLAKTITRPVVSALQSIGSQAGDSLNRARRGDLDARLAYGRDSTPIPQPGSAAIAPLGPVHGHNPLVTTTIRNGQTKADARPTTRI